MKKIKLTILFFLLSGILFAQQIKPPFFNEIRSFKKQDSISYPQKNAILFVGSSSFTKWTDAQDYFPGYPIINRGFGGSSLTDVIRYKDEIIFPYQPKQIVIYCGENDIAGDSDVTGLIVFERFKTLYQDIREKMPNVPIAYISMKPSPSRWNMKERMISGNEMIKLYLNRKELNAKFIDVWSAMLGKDGKPIADIFIEDELHMNAKGYAIWQKIIQPYLIK